MYFRVYYPVTTMGETTLEVDKFSADSHIFKEGVVVFFNHKEDEAIPIKVYPIINLIKIEMMTDEQKEKMDKLIMDSFKINKESFLKD